MKKIRPGIWIDWAYDVVLVNDDLSAWVWFKNIEWVYLRSVDVPSFLESCSFVSEL